jgi:hypothetical protein
VLLAVPLPPAVVRTDGPPFVDIKSKQGKGFEVDYDKVSKHLGAGKVRVDGGRGRNAPHPTTPSFPPPLTRPPAPLSNAPRSCHWPTSCATLSS